LQHESRLVENSARNFTGTHRLLYADLLGLATNHYSEVRIRGQDVLARALRYYSYSYQELLPRLLDLLKSGTGVSHEQFKAVLWNRNRNRTNRNFFTSEIRTGVTR
jgi:hypothetical protein